MCVTAQHRDLLDQVNELFGIEPDHDLDLMRPNQELNALAARAIGGLDEVIRRERPAAVLVQGDTTTAFAGALAAFHLRVPVGHVEAGLRTWDLDAPFPEELNRQLIGRIARWHFAPTRGALENLSREGLPADRIVVTGNTAIDALQHVSALLERSHAGRSATSAEPDGERGRLLVVTAHRRESFGAPMDDICTAIRRVTAEHGDLSVVFSVHPNPNVRERVHAQLGGLERVELVDPMSYRDFVALLTRAWAILSDSGGVQEEAPGLHKPVLVMRDKTERPEAVEAGTSRLVGTDPERIASAVRELTDDPAVYRQMTTAPNPFGDGRAAERILERLGRDLIG